MCVHAENTKPGPKIISVLVTGKTIKGGRSPRIKGFLHFT